MQTLLEKAQKELVKGNNREAFLVAKEVLKLNPKDTKALLVAGYACELMDDADQAIQLYETALEFAPTQDVVIQLRQCVERRAKLDPTGSARAGDIALKEDDIGKEFENVFTKRERAVYDRFISVDEGRRLAMVISQKPGGAISITEPHFGGEPYAEKGTTWPSCKNCLRAKNFVGQFAWDPSVNDVSKQNLSTEWLVTLFHCFGCRPASSAPPLTKGENSGIYLYKNPRQDSHVTIAPAKDTRAPYLMALEHYRYDLKEPELVQSVQLLSGGDFIPKKYVRARIANAAGFEPPLEYADAPDRAYIGGLSDTVVTLDFSLKLEIRYDRATDSCVIAL